MSVRIPIQKLDYKSDVTIAFAVGSNLKLGSNLGSKFRGRILVQKFEPESDFGLEVRVRSQIGVRSRVGLVSDLGSLSSPKSGVVCQVYNHGSKIGSRVKY
ncbi:hypothetical protein KY284_008144 [Solanum tuberosum]|nr:hypothetical protein KY284_008144 [Solanum tuberosum]